MPFSARLATLLLVGGAAAACAPRDATVGVGREPPGADAGTDADADARSDALVLFSSELALNGGLWDVFAPLPGASVTFGAASASRGSRDGRVAALVFPGDPTLTAGDRIDSDLNTGIATRQLFPFGTLRARVQFAACAADQEVASAVFMYLADGQDGNANGLTDLHELDLQILCGAPSFIVLGAWSDYQIDSAGAASYLKHSRAIDTATGDVYDTPVASAPGFTKTGHAPELAHPGFPAPDTFYDVGIEWQADHVRFFMGLDGDEVTLWNLTELAYVPQVPLPMMFNLWHPGTHWVPTATPADYPSRDAVLLVDWAEWRAP